MTDRSIASLPNSLDADVLVIGAGVAGMCAALAAAPRRVLLLCPSEPQSSASSALAQGGIAAPLGPNDSVESHVTDTLEAASFSADRRIAEMVIGGATDTIAYLETHGVEFDRDGPGRSLHLEAGHSHARVVHASGDRSGAVIVAALWARVRAAAHVEILTGWRAVSLVGGRKSAISGALIGSAHGDYAGIAARDTVLATGGLGQLFAQTTNSPESTGDGLAMAIAAGAPTAALEFVQFHPTALAVDADPLPLLTEALRGAGALLVTEDGERIMVGRHVRAELAPRDVVARIVYERTMMREQVFLDARGVFQGPNAGAFPQARATALRFGIDPALNPLPVTAAAHYHMGGVIVDARGGTSHDGLWACGEVAYTGLHGANRLASNSLLEAVHFGRAVGSALSIAKAAECRFSSASAVNEAGPAGPSSVDGRLRKRIWEALGPVRHQDTLRLAIVATRDAIKSTPCDDLLASNRLRLALAMLNAAVARAESRGAHWRRDFPNRDARRDGPNATALS